MKFVVVPVLALALLASSAASGQNVGAGANVGPVGAGANVGSAGTGVGVHVGGVGVGVGVSGYHRYCRGGWYWHYHHRYCRRW